MIAGQVTEGKKLTPNFFAAHHHHKLFHNNDLQRYSRGHSAVADER